MSGRTTPKTNLTVFSDAGVEPRVFHGPVGITGPAAAPLGSPEWLREIWASGEPVADDAFKAATASAKAVHGPHEFTFLSSSFFGREAQLFVVGEEPVKLAATRLYVDEAQPQENPANPGETKPLVTKVIAWTDMSLMTAEEKAEFEAADAGQ